MLKPHPPLPVDGYMLDRPLPLAHLDVELAWMRALLMHHLRTLQLQGKAPALEDPWPGTLISPLLIETRLHARATQAALDEILKTQLLKAQQELEHCEHQRQRVLALRRQRETAPLAALRESYQLSQVEYLLVLLALSVELDPDIALLLSYLQGHYEKRLPTLALLHQLSTTQPLAYLTRPLLDAHHRLVSACLIELDPSRPAEPILHRGFRIHPRVLRFIEGEQGLAPELKAFATLEDATAPLPELVLGTHLGGVWDDFRQVMARPTSTLHELPLQLLLGTRGAGRKRWAYEFASAHHLRLLTVDLALLAQHPGSLEHHLRLLAREAVLWNALCCFTHLEDAFEAPLPNGNDASPERSMELHRQKMVRLLDEAFEAFPYVVLLSASDTLEKVPRFKRSVQVHRLVSLDQQARQVLWERHLPPAWRSPKLSIEEVTRRFDLSPGRTLEAITAARAIAEGQGLTKIKLPFLVEAVRDQIQARMGQIARLKPCNDRWSDLITTPEVGLQLRELCHRYRLRGKVLNEWGLGARFSSAMGVSALFEGAPGTGKTMSAGVIARDLGLDLYQVELSQVVSKWIGETEKNLSRVFDEAERSGAMLLFDEADSIFSKRTSVSSSNDRYANLEVNYLLQRVERFSGIAILTTNFADSIDSAFARRLSMRVTFPKPSVEERERLWVSMLSLPNLPVAEDVDCYALGDEFDLAGGLIKNAVLRAAFLSAARDIPINQDLLHLSARIEMKEHGMLIRGNPHADLVELLMAMPGHP